MACNIIMSTKLKLWTYVAFIEELTKIIVFVYLGNYNFYYT